MRRAVETRRSIPRPGSKPIRTKKAAGSGAAAWVFSLAAALVFVTASLLVGSGHTFWGGLLQTATAPKDSVISASSPISPVTGERPVAKPSLAAVAATATATPVATPEPADSFLFSFAGDCTLGDEQDRYGRGSGFVRTVGDDYDYPLSYAREYFADDELTVVNLEGALTRSTAAREKDFRFRGPPEYANILSAGSVECVSLANNHAGDFGPAGLADTQEALKAAGVRYATREKSCVIETRNGLKVGVYAAYFPGVAETRARVQALRQQDVDVVIAFFHWGVEKSYRPDANQIALAHAAIDAGADIAVGAHPHVLQPMETYKGHPILYSLGNFAFGGKQNPDDRDTAIAQQEFLRGADGSVALGRTMLIPFAISGSRGRNNYQPVPYQPGTAEYERVIKKLGTE